MSVIAGLCRAGSGTTWIGSDTMVVSANLKQQIGPKWILRRPWAVGVAGHLRTIDLFRHHGDELLADLSGAFEFADRARELMKSDGYRDGGDEEAGPRQYGQTLLLARPGRLWTVGADFSLIEVPAGELWAEGTGRELALGAAHALRAVQSGLAAGEIVRHAVEAAVAHDSSCGGDAWVEALGEAAPAAA